VLHELIDKSQEHHIEYQVYLANHMVHALVALHRLGARPERLREYYADYAKKLEPSVAPASRIGEHNWREFVGAKQYFLDYVEFFLQQIEQSSVRAVLLKYLPTFTDSLAACAFHTLIELGYGLVSGTTRGVARGLAYMCYGYISFGTLPPYEKAADSSPAYFEVLGKIAHDSALDDTSIVAKRKEGFQNCLVYLTSNYQQPMLACYQMWYRDLGSKPTATIMEWVRALMRGLVSLHHATGDRRFFVLHGVTSLYALKKVLLALGDERDEEKDTTALKLSLFRHFWFMMFPTYIAEGKPKLPTGDEPIEQTPLSWNELQEKVIEHDDEHVLKLVQVCKEEYEEEVALNGGNDASAQLFLNSAYWTWKHQTKEGEAWLYWL